MRRLEDYLQQCQYITKPDISDSEKSHYSKVYGINRMTILNELPYFDVTENLPQDLMHVLLEGVFPCHLEQLLNYIVYESSILSISQINCRLKSFPYAYFQEKPCPIAGRVVGGTQSSIH